MKQVKCIYGRVVDLLCTHGRIGANINLVFCLCKVVVNYTKSGIEAEEVCREVSTRIAPST
jgi:hypothetical protein